MENKKERNKKENNIKLTFIIEATQSLLPF